MLGYESSAEQNAASGGGWDGDHGHWIGWYEQELQAQFREFIRPGMIAWDIGANIGFFTLLASRLVTETGRVLAVEPHPSFVEVLREHIRRTS